MLRHLRVLIKTGQYTRGTRVTRAGQYTRGLIIGRAAWTPRGVHELRGNGGGLTGYYYFCILISVVVWVTVNCRVNHFTFRRSIKIPPLHIFNGFHILCTTILL